MARRTLVLQGVVDGGALSGHDEGGREWFGVKRDGFCACAFIWSGTSRLGEMDRYVSYRCQRT